MEEPVRRSVGPSDRITYAPSERWVRGVKGTTTVVESRRPVLVWEPGRPVPFYAFPRSDLRAGELVEPAKPPRQGTRAGATFFDLVVDGERLANAAWTYPGEALQDTVSLGWADWGVPGLDHWYEEDEEIFVHPRDPFSHIDVIPSTRHLVVELQGQVVAETRTPVLLFETGLPIRFYLPREDVRLDLFVPTESHTRCPYKGIASYWSYVGPGDQVVDIVWTYPDPLRGVAPIKDRLAFYNEHVDLTVDGVRLERPVSPFTRRRDA